METHQALHTLKALLEAAEFHHACGLNEAIQESPQLYLKSPKAEPPKVQTQIQAQEQEQVKEQPQTQKQNQLHLGTQQAIAEATRLALSAATLEALHQIISEFEHCDLARTANHSLAGITPQEPLPQSVMVIIDRPSLEDDQTGEPFIHGEVNQLLNNMLKAIGLNFKQIYISYRVFWRPPGGRSLRTNELAICRPFLLRQFSLIKPDYIYFMGQSVAQDLIGSNNLGEDWIDFDLTKALTQANMAAGDQTQFKPIPSLVGFSPAFLLKTPKAKPKAWHQLLKLHRKLNQS